MCRDIASVWDGSLDYVTYYVPNYPSHQTHCNFHLTGEYYLLFFFVPCPTALGVSSALRAEMMRDAATLFKPCLKSVLPTICNGKVSKNGVNTADVRTHLQS